MIRKLVSAIKRFDLIVFCRNNAPHNELAYTSLGIFGTISSICTMYSVSNATGIVRLDELLLFYQSMLICSVLFVTYPIWPQIMKQDVVVQVAWNFIVFYLLIFCSSFCLFLSNFSHLQIVIFMVNLIVMAIVLTNWKLTFVFIIAGIYYGRAFYKYYMDVDDLDIDLDSTNLILYSFLLSGTAIIIFFKPQHDELKWTAKTIDHFKSRLSAGEAEVEKAQKIKYDFLRNIEHELNTPLSSIMSSTQTLHDSYSKLTHLERQSAIVRILSASERLHNFVTNMIYLSKLLDTKMELQKKNINFSTLFKERAIICRKQYAIEDGKQELITDITRDIFIDCDVDYMKQALDNLIINAIKYCPNGRIVASLKTNESQIELVVIDEGIGIPPSELYDVFQIFTVSSRTATPAGGRGVGLALCKEVITKHGGTIRAESDGRNGSTFRIIIPLGLQHAQQD